MLSCFFFFTLVNRLLGSGYNAHVPEGGWMDFKGPHPPWAPRTQGSPENASSILIDVKQCLLKIEISNNVPTLKCFILLLFQQCQCKPP